ncbi:MAG: hypothetical protein L0Y72_19720 [Gemmataceae bacterium]|nr:hypothetical protein [Gemmataceae bacterium]MCI0741266.1 hypothetical protein [Gemmataceae bacterium]
MRQYLCLFSGAAVLLLTTAVQARDKANPYKQAKVAALRFANALNERAADDLIPLAKTPFVDGHRYSFGRGKTAVAVTLTTEKDLRDLVAKVEGKLPLEVAETIRYGDRELLYHPNARTALTKTLDRHDYVVFLRHKEEWPRYPVFVRVNAGQAKVVGWLGTRLDDDPKAKQQAQDAAVLFAKAFNERSTTGMFKVLDIPFLAGHRQLFGSGPPDFLHLVESHSFGSASLGSPNRSLDSYFEGKLPDEVARVVKYENEPCLFVGKEEMEALDRLLGDNGYVVTFREKKKRRPFAKNHLDMEYPIFVRVSEGRARVVGWLWTEREAKALGAK